MSWPTPIHVQHVGASMIAGKAPRQDWSIPAYCVARLLAQGSRVRERLTNGAWLRPYRVVTRLPH